jgi:hypothetical protein
VDVEKYVWRQRRDDCEKQERNVATRLNYVRRINEEHIARHEACQLAGWQILDAMANDAGIDLLELRRFIRFDRDQLGPCAFTAVCLKGTMSESRRLTASNLNDATWTKMPEERVVHLSVCGSECWISVMRLDAAARANRNRRQFGAVAELAEQGKLGLDAYVNSGQESDAAASTTNKPNLRIVVMVDHGVHTQFVGGAVDVTARLVIGRSVEPDDCESRIQKWQPEPLGYATPDAAQDIPRPAQVPRVHSQPMTCA